MILHISNSKFQFWFAKYLTSYDLIHTIPWDFKIPEDDGFGWISDQAIAGLYLTITFAVTNRNAIVKYKLSVFTALWRTSQLHLVRYSENFNSIYAVCIWNGYYRWFLRSRWLYDNYSICRLKYKKILIQ